MAATRSSRDRAEPEAGPRAERRRPQAPPAAASGTAPRIAVAGTAISETVQHGPGESRSGIGGVAGNMAEALAWAGNPVTMITSIGRGPAGREAERLLEELGIHVEAVRDSRPAGQAVIQTRSGEQGSARGRWPMPEGLWQVMDRIAGECAALAADAHMSRSDLQRLLDRPRMTTLANGTSARSAPRILSARIPGLGMAAMNRAEMNSVLESLPLRDRRGSPQEAVQESVRRALRAETLLVTRAREGWTLTGRGGPCTSAAVEVPPRTDFVGCGDWAAAGALHAALHGLDPVETINGFIAQKLRNNAAAAKPR